VAQVGERLKRRNEMEKIHTIEQRVDPKGLYQALSRVFAIPTLGELERWADGNKEALEGFYSRWKDNVFSGPSIWTNQAGCVRIFTDTSNREITAAWAQGWLKSVVCDFGGSEYAARKVLSHLETLTNLKITYRNGDGNIVTCEWTNWGEVKKGYVAPDLTLED
jgi:hypothetical protein